MMKYTAKLRPLALLLALALLVTVIGCSKDGGSSAPSSGGSAAPTDSVSEPVSDGDETVIDRVFQIEKIDKGIERNPDTVGWIYIPNTTVDGAVLQRNDPNVTVAKENWAGLGISNAGQANHYANSHYYLRLDEDKKYNIFGSYYADPTSKMGGRDQLSKNTIIYGHSDYKDDGKGPRFSQLHKYTDIEFLKSNPYVYYSTEEEDMVWQIFSVFYTNWKDFDYIQGNPSKEAFEKIISEAKARSEYVIDMDVKDGDKIITLSTCTGLYNPTNRDDYRFVVMAKLLPTNEVSSATMEAKVNPNPKKS